MNCKFCGGLCDWVIQGFDEYGTIRELSCQECGRWQDEDLEVEGVVDEGYNESSDPEEIARANSHIVGARRAKLSQKTFDKLSKMIEDARNRRNRS